MNKWLLAPAALILASISSVSFAAGDAAAGKAKAAACAGCHGPTGQGISPDFPKLAGQGEAYLADQLAQFKNGTRQNALMTGMVAGLSDADMANLAAFYASQEASIGKAKPELVELGGTIYKAGNKATGVTACIGCHGPKGEGNAPAKFPQLAGQYAKYTAAQLKAYKDGTRKTTQAAIMVGVAKNLTDAEIEAVASYIEGLH